MAEHPREPFPGIEPFGFHQSEVFFGRDADARSLLQLTELYRAVLLYASSGIGKSSLLNAKLIPLLIQEGYRVERLRVQPRPGQELAIQPITADGSGYPAVFSRPEGARVLAAAELRPRLGGTPDRKVLIFDQFEEWVTHFEEGDEPAGLAKRNILEALVEVIREASLSVKVVFAFRQDYYGDLRPLFERLPTLPDHFLQLAPLPEESIETILRGPFEKFPGKYSPELSAGLAKQIRSGFHQRTRGAGVSLTEVQIVCRELYDSGLRGSELEKLYGQLGVQGLLERFFDRSLGALPAAQRDPAVLLLKRMVTAAGTRNLISRDVLVALLGKDHQVSPELAEATLASLENVSRLIRREHRRGVDLLELVSEFLIGWILGKAREVETRLEQKVQEKALLKRVGYLVGALSLVAALATYWIRSAELAAEATSNAAKTLAFSSIFARESGLDLALLLAVESRRVEDLYESRSSLLAALQAHPRLRKFLHGFQTPVVDLEFSADGGRLAGTSQGEVIAWDLPSGRQLGRSLETWDGGFARLEPAGTDRFSVIYRPSPRDPRTVLAEWQPAAGDPVVQQELLLGGPAAAAAASPDRRWLAVAGRDQAGLRLVELATGRQVPLADQPSGITCLLFDPQGRFLAAGGADSIVLWDTAEWRRRKVLRQPAGVWNLAFSADRARLASAGNDGTVLLWNLGVADPELAADCERSPGEAVGPVACLEGHSDRVIAVRFSPDGKILASAGSDATIRLWDVATGKTREELIGHEGPVRSLAFSPDGATLASSASGAVYLWELRSSHFLARTLPAPDPAAADDDVFNVAFSPDGRLLASGHKQSTIVLRDTATGEIHIRLHKEEGAKTKTVESLAFGSGPDPLVAAGSEDGFLRLWDLASPLEPAILRSPDPALPCRDEEAGTAKTCEIWAVAFSQDGHWLAFGDEEGNVGIWDGITRMERVKPRKIHQKAVSSVAFHPDGRWLASASFDGTVIFSAPETLEEVGKLELPEEFAGEIISLALRPDGRMAVAIYGPAGKRHDSILLYDPGTRNWTPVGTHRGYIQSVAFSPDGTLLASGGNDRRVLLWDLRNPNQPRALGEAFRPFPNKVTSLAFSPDGRLLASGNRAPDRESQRRQATLDASTLKLWDVDPESWRRRACERANRNLTDREWKIYLRDQGPAQPSCPDPGRP